MRSPAGLIAGLSALVLLAVAGVLLTHNSSDSRTSLLSKDKKWALDTLVSTARWKEHAQEQRLAKEIKSAEQNARATYPGHFKHHVAVKSHQAQLHAAKKPHVVPKQVKLAEKKAARFNSATKVLEVEEQRIRKLRQMVAHKGKMIRGLTARAKHADRAAVEDKELAAEIRQKREVEEKSYHQELAALTREARRAVSLEKGGVAKLAKFKGLKPMRGALLAEEEAKEEEKEEEEEEAAVELQKLPGDVSQEDCMPPDVWLEDACRQSPRLDEPPVACGAHPDPEECDAWKAAWKKKMVVYQKALRENYPYRYEPDHHLLKHGWGKHQVNHLALPVRYPHKDLADLGDNYISTSWSDRDHSKRPRPMADDIIVPQHKAQPMHSAEGFMSTFMGKGEPTETPLFAANKVTAEEKARLEDEEHNNLFFAQNEDKMGERSPTEPEVKKLLYGKSSDYMRNKYGYLADVYPSTRQMERQIQPENSRERTRAYPAAQEGKGKAEADRFTEEGDEQFPARTNLKSRFRRECATCDWKAVLEPATAPCDGELCSETKPAIHPAMIKVCDPLRGCVEHEDWVKNNDPMERQILDGQVNGRADPWGFDAELGDDRMSPEQAVEHKRYAQ